MQKQLDHQESIIIGTFWKYFIESYTIIGTSDHKEGVY